MTRLNTEEHKFVSIEDMNNPLDSKMNKYENVRANSKIEFSR